VFCEVKAKSREHYGDPLEMVSPEKLRRLVRAGETWLAGRPDCAGLEVSFEAVGIHGGQLQRVALVP
jgi:Holliday junction resolvase-like predicted endonuclease